MILRRPRLGCRAALCLGLVLVVTSGCARVRLTPAQVREQFGTIGVTVTEGTIGTAFARPMTSREDAAAMAATEAVGGALSGGLANGPLGLVIGVAIAPLAGIGGAIYGAAAAQPPALVAQGAETLERAVKELEIPRALREMVILELGKRGPYRDVVAHDPASPPPGASVKTHLNVSVSSVQLVGKGINPSLRLYIGASMSLDGRGVESRSRVLAVGARGRTFRRWAADDALLFRKTVMAALDELAAKIANEVLYAPRPPHSFAGSSAVPASPVVTAPSLGGPAHRAPHSAESAAREALCRSRHLAYQNSWRDRLADYQACLAQ